MFDILKIECNIICLMMIQLKCNFERVEVKRLSKLEKDLIFNDLASSSLRKSLFGIKKLFVLLFVNPPIIFKYNASNPILTI